MKKLFQTLFIFVYFPAQFLISQTNCSQKFYDDPFDAELICSNQELDNICQQMTIPGLNFNPISSCFAINNNIWIRFIAKTPQLQLRLNVSNCKLNEGVWMSVYNVFDNNNFININKELFCDDPTTGSKILTINNLVPFAEYYMMFDGAEGDICEFNLDLVSGKIAEFNEFTDFSYNNIASKVSLYSEYTTQQSWKFNNNITLTLDNPTGLVLTDSIVVLSHRSECGNSVITKSLYIDDDFYADFDINRTTICTNDIIQLNNLSGTKATSFQWTALGATNPLSNDNDVSLTYKYPGTYQIKLEAKYQNYTAVKYKKINVLDTTYDFSYSIKNIKNRDYEFNNVNIHNSVWDFGDGTYATNAQYIITTRHIYPKDGTYTVKLTVYSPCGTKTYTKTITVKSTIYADFEFDQLDYCANDTVSFTNTSSNLSNFEWIILPSTYKIISSQNILKVVFASSGSYSVTLKGINNGLNYSYDQNVIIPDKAFKGIEYDQYGISTIEFNASIAKFGKINSFFWDFGDSTTSNIKDPTHTYTDQSNRFVFLITKNKCGTTTTYLDLLIRKSCQPYATEDPCNAPLLCSTQALDNYCGFTGAPKKPVIPDFFCGVVTNNHWISFIASTSTLKLKYNLTNCLQRDGIQVAIYYYDSCFQFNYLIDCFNILDNEPIKIKNLERGEKYFLMIDGYEGDMCDYEVDVLEGQIGGDMLIKPTVLNGTKNICVGGQFDFNIPPVLGGIRYNWNIESKNAVFLQIIDTTFTLLATEPGKIKVCVDVFGACGGFAQNCWDINATEVIGINPPPFELCIGGPDAVDPCGNVYTYGNGTPTIETAKCTLLSHLGCDSIIEVNIKRNAVAYNSTVYGNKYVCLNSTNNYSIINANNNVKWVLPNNAYTTSALINNNNIQIKWNEIGTQKIKVVSDNICFRDTMELEVTVGDSNDFDLITTKDSFCLGDTINVSLLSYCIMNPIITYSSSLPFVNSPSGFIANSSGIKNIMVSIFDGTNTATRNKYVWVLDKPVVDIFYTKQLQTYSFYTNTVGEIYFWDFGDGTTSIENNPSKVYATNGNYIVKLTVSNKCGSTTITKSIVTTSNKDISAITSFNLYPNPTNGNINIELIGTPIKESIKLCIYNTLGQEMISEKLDFNAGILNQQIDLSNFSNGTYIVRLISGNETFVKKIVKSL
jgi:PKD repeat protein